MTVMESMFSIQPLSPAVKKHVAEVYGTLALMAAFTAGGLWTHFYFMEGGMITALLAFGSAIAVQGSADTKESRTWRTALTHAFAFLKGMTLGPLVEFLPDVIPMAVGATVCVFACFSLMAYITNRRVVMYIGGLVGSAIVVLFWMSLANLFVRSAAMFDVELYLGLIVFAGYIVCDTQKVIMDAENNNFDTLSPAINLYVNVVAVFVRFALIFARQDDDKKRRTTTSVR